MHSKLKIDHDQHAYPVTAKGLVLCLLAAVAVLPAGARPVFAQGLTDPTLPPAAFRPPNLKGTGIASESVEQEPIVEPITSLKLQALMIGPADNYAVVDGAVLRVGTSFKGWRVIKIGREGVLLEGIQGSRLLRPHPAISIKPQN